MKYMTPSEIMHETRKMPILLKWTLEQMTPEQLKQFTDLYCTEVEKFEQAKAKANVAPIKRPNNAREVSNMMKHIGKLGN